MMEKMRSNVTRVSMNGLCHAENIRAHVMPMPPVLTFGAETDL